MYRWRGRGAVFCYCVNQFLSPTYPVEGGSGCFPFGGMDWDSAPSTLVQPGPASPPSVSSGRFLLLPRPLCNPEVEYRPLFLVGDLLSLMPAGGVCLPPGWVCGTVGALPGAEESGVLPPICLNHVLWAAVGGRCGSPHHTLGE